jgi:hypothetical protein
MSESKYTCFAKCFSRESLGKSPLTPFELKIIVIRLEDKVHFFIDQLCAVYGWKYWGCHTQPPTSIQAGNWAPPVQLNRDFDHL